jgi:hypothetical protein
MALVRIVGRLATPGFLNAALRAWWIWSQKTDSSKPWSRLHFKVLPKALAIFNASIQISVGDSAKTRF